MKIIPSRVGFLAARSKGKKALAIGLVIQAVTRDSDDWRIGLTATKKIGNAVTRNRARRRMRALARDHLSPLAKNGIDYVLIARHDTATANWQDMAKGLQKAIGYLHRTYRQLHKPKYQTETPSQASSLWQTADHRTDHEPVWRF
jgi:ribonuclease P protein component